MTIMSNEAGMHLSRRQRRLILWIFSLTTDDSLSTVEAAHLVKYFLPATHLNLSTTVYPTIVCAPQSIRCFIESTQCYVLTSSE